MNAVTLADIKPGRRARVLRFNPGNANYRRRLLAMGLIPGAEFVVSRLAPLGDPIAIRLLDCVLTLRKAEAALMCLEPLD